MENNQTQEAAMQKKTYIARIAYTGGTLNGLTRSYLVQAEDEQEAGRQALAEHERRFPGATRDMIVKSVEERDVEREAASAATFYAGKAFDRRNDPAWALD